MAVKKSGERPKTDVEAEPIDDERMIEVTSQEEIPEFHSEADLDAFWSTHYGGQANLERTGLARVPRGPSPRVRRALELPAREPLFGK
ncbi:MAG: hypothetical protein ACR2PL_28420 [Dehalococcoidia bacterium]